MLLLVELVVLVVLHSTPLSPPRSASKSIWPEVCAAACAADPPGAVCIDCTAWAPLGSAAHVLPPRCRCARAEVGCCTMLSNSVPSGPPSLGPRTNHVVSCLFVRGATYSLPMTHVSSHIVSPNNRPQRSRKVTPQHPLGLKAEALFGGCSTITIAIIPSLFIEP